MKGPARLVAVLLLLALAGQVSSHSNNVAEQLELNVAMQLERAESGTS